MCFCWDTYLWIFSQITCSLSSLCKEEDSVPLERSMRRIGEVKIAFYNLKVASHAYC